MSAFKDHFSGNSSDYARARPDYPGALHDWLAAVAPRRALAWDCGCGAGQAALGMVERFDRVVATDASADQIAAAPRHPRIDYAVAPAEASGIPSDSVDLIVVAQALHWFDHDRFHVEARRVAAPGCVLAAVTYALFRIDPVLDAAIDAFYWDVAGPYWPPERRHVETDYRDIPFPFARIEAPKFRIDREWRLGDVLAMVNTWSALKALRKATGRDPLPDLEHTLAPLWGGPPETIRAVHWDVTVLAGVVRPL